MEEERTYFGLYLSVLVYHWGKSDQKLKQERRDKLEEARILEEFYLLPHSLCYSSTGFLVYQHLTPRKALPTVVGMALPLQSMVKMVPIDMFTGWNDVSNFFHWGSLFSGVSSGRPKLAITVSLLQTNTTKFLAHGLGLDLGSHIISNSIVKENPRQFTIL